MAAEVAVSVEYFAYLTDPTPIPVAALAECCRSRGFVIYILREFAGWSRFRLVTDGAVESGDVVCGWAISTANASGVETAFKQRSAKELASHEAAGQLGVFEAEVWGNPDAYNANLDEEADGYAGGYSDARTASAVRWYVRAAAGSGELSATLPESVI